jgi:mono/diheme cytochrome c family protein
MHKKYLATRVLPAVILFLLVGGGPLYAGEAESIFVANCAECHGSEGYGTETAPSLHNIEFLAKCDVETVYYFIRSGATGYTKRFPQSKYPTSMPGYEKELSSEEIKVLAGMIIKWNP